MSSITIKDLAQKLNLSPSTISKALKDSYEINAETKLRVKEMAKQLKYVPNSYAAGLRKKTSQTIAVIVPNITDAFFAKAIYGIHSAANQNNYNVLIYISSEDYKNEKLFIESLGNGKVDGIIISLSGNNNNHEYIRFTQDEGLPVVLFDCVDFDIDTTKIISDDYTNGIKATEHLLQRGCRNIAYLGISEQVSTDISRREGYKFALEKAHIAFDPELMITYSHNTATNISRIKSVLQNKKPDGLVASIHDLAIAAYYACNELNIKIGQEVKIIGFSNFDAVDLFNPPLTTITQPAFNIGEQAATILIQSLEKKNYTLKNEVITLPSVLYKRASTQ
jgi:LacI family transcriptional regulator